MERLSRAVELGLRYSSHYRVEVRMSIPETKREVVARALREAFGVG